jgi:hypothetical protein
MTIAVAGQSALTNICDTQFPSSGTIGHATLLKGDLTLNLGVSVNASAGEFTASGHGFVTGSRVTVAGTTLPTPLVASTDYYAIRISASTIKLATTLANAIAGTFIALSDAGSAVQLNEQRLVATDRLEVLLNKEISHPNFPNRRAITNVGAASINASTGVAEKEPNSFLLSITSATSLQFRHVLLLLGAGVSSTLGSATGVDAFYLSDEGDLTLVTGDLKAVSTQFRARSV